MTQQHSITPSKSELFGLLMQSGGANRVVSIEWLEPFAQAILARWGHPVFRQKELTDEQLLKCFKIATPCYNMEDWRRELDGMRAAIAADRALCDRLAVEPVPESPTGEEVDQLSHETWKLRKSTQWAIRTALARWGQVVITTNHLHD
jgi:hypothetical protein